MIETDWNWLKMTENRPKWIELGTEKYLPPPPREQEKKISGANSGFIHPHGRYGNAVKTMKTISTIAILWPVKAIFEKRAATVEVDTLISAVESRQESGGKPCEIAENWLRREKTPNNKPAQIFPYHDTAVFVDQVHLQVSFLWGPQGLTCDKKR